MNRVLLSALSTDTPGGLPVALDVQPPHRAAFVDAVAATHPRTDLLVRCALLDGCAVTVAVRRTGTYGPVIVAEDATLRRGGTFVVPARHPERGYLASRLIDVAPGHRAVGVLRDALRPSIAAQPPLDPLSLADLATLQPDGSVALLVYGSLAPDLTAEPATLWAAHLYDHTTEVVHATCRPPDGSARVTGPVAVPAAVLLAADVGVVPLREPLPTAVLRSLSQFSDPDLRAWLRALSATRTTART